MISYLRYYLIFFSILIISIFSNKTFSQKNNLLINLDGSLRYRYEIWNGMNAKNYGDNSPEAIGKIKDDFLLQRVILGINSIYKNRYIFAFHIQDSRAFGWSLRNSIYPDLFKVRNNASLEPYYKMNPQEEFFEIYDLYFEANKVINSLNIKLGRQKIFYGDNRIFGPGDWGNTGRWTWDALKISYKKDKNFIDIFAGGTKIHDPEKISLLFTKTEFWGGGLYSHLEMPQVLNFELFYAYKTAGSADYINTFSFDRHWIGTRLFNQDIYSFLTDATIVYQFGNNQSKNISAYALAAKFGYQFNFLPFKPIISICEAYASGGKNTDNKIRTFEPVFGAADKYYGRMNITSWSNIDDREIILELFPNKNIWIELKYNMFYIPETEGFKLLKNLMLKPGKKHLGNEFNIFVTYEINKNWQLVGSYGYFCPKDVLDINFEKPKNALMTSFQILYSFNKNLFCH